VDTSSVIIMEHHAAWPACAEQYQTVFPGSLVEVQDEAESPMDFAERVGRRMFSVASKGGRPRVVIIAVSGSLDPLALQGRQQVVQVAVQAMGLSGELVLSGPSPSTHLEHAARVRRELLALTDMLSRELACTEIVVSVRLTDDSAPSERRPRVQMRRR